MSRNVTAYNTIKTAPAFLLALLLLVLLSRAPAAAQEAPARVFFPDLLPAGTIACLVPPGPGSEDAAYSASMFRRLAQLPEMGPFVAAFEESRRQLAADITGTAKIPPQLALDLVGANLGLALISVTAGPGGRPLPEFALALSLRSAADRDMVYSAVTELLNRPEIVRTVLESQGLDPNLPLKTLAQDEALPGYPPILRIGPNIRVAAVGNLVLIYHGPGSEGIRKIFDAAASPASSLARSSDFAAAYRGAEAQPGGSFVYIDLPRTIALLDAMGQSAVTRFLDSLGLGGVRAVGVAGSYAGDGVRHGVYLVAPGGVTGGLLSAISALPAGSPVGLEAYSQSLPAAASAFTALRVDMAALVREAPYFLESAAALAVPGGVAGLAASEQILGVALAEILPALGGDIVIRPHDDTQVLIFQNADIAAFESVIERMEQNAGMRFSSLNVGGYIVRYFNRRASLSAPLAPSFCLIPHAPGSPMGVLYLASHPQAVTSLIQEAAAAREAVAAGADFQKAVAGMGTGYSLFHYNGDLDSYRRVYNFLLPVAALWSSSSRYPVDTGLLPTAASIMPAFFGSSIGLKILPGGLFFQAYSPIGANALLVALADKLVVSSPIVMAYAYSALETWVRAVPGW